MHFDDIILYGDATWKTEHAKPDVEFTKHQCASQGRESIFLFTKIRIPDQLLAFTPDHTSLSLQKMTHPI